MEFTSMPSGEAMAAVARKRTEEIRVNFILMVGEEKVYREDVAWFRGLFGL
jgi:hypothetical protein